MAESDILSQLEIDSLLASLTGGKPLGDAGNAAVAQEMTANTAMQVASVMENVNIDEEKKGYKLYNFRRPDKFSKDHLRALQDIHKEFSRQLALILSAYLRLHVGIDVVSVDQLTYDEFTRSMPTPITIGILELNPLPSQMLLGLSHEVISSIVDRMLGGIGASEYNPRELTDIEEALVKKVIEKIKGALETAWKTVFPIQANIIDIENNYSVIQIANPGEIVALVTLEVQISSKFSGLMSLCFPFPLLETVIEQLNSQHIFQQKGILTSSDDKKKMLQKLNNAFVNINVLFGQTDISLKDFIDLKEGDVIKLDNSVKDNLIICVNDEQKFNGRPGMIKNKIAVKIVDSYSGKEDII